MGDFQRALVFQGGGALGTYEAGTYQQMYRKASKESPDGRLFDIVAGTSIGAINSRLCFTNLDNAFAIFVYERPRKYKYRP